MRNVFFHILVVVLTLAIVCLVRHCQGHDTIEDKIEIVRDTVTIRDTIYIDAPIVKTRIVKDTIHIFDKDTVPVTMLVEQKVYEGNDYTAWVSGIDPTLDSIRVYSQTQVIKENVTITKNIKDNSAHFYLGVAAQVNTNNIAPSIMLSCQKNKWLFGANLGIMNNKPIYGININYQIR